MVQQTQNHRDRFLILIENHVKKGNQSFEVRSNKGEFKKGDEINISEYRYIYK